MSIDKHFINPWEDEPAYIYLGSRSIGNGNSDGSTRHYDLYALKGARADKHVSFGARFSNEPSDYASGSAEYSNGKWTLYGRGEIAEAAALYFANHHKQSQLTKKDNTVKLAIVIEKGIIQAIVTDSNLIEVNLDIATIDYDTEGCTDDELTDVIQADKSTAQAYVIHHDVQMATIDLDSVFKP